MGQIEPICFRYHVRLQDGTFTVYHPKPTGWTDFVLNYIGPNNGEGIKMFYNGAGAGGDSSKSIASLVAGDSRIVVGRHYTNRDSRYASVQVDELVFFNQYLSIEQIRKLQNAF